MQESPFFEAVAEALERETTLGRLEARGTLRFALKGAGFDAQSVNRPQMLASILRSLPEELRRRGIPEPDALCERLARLLAAAAEPAARAARG
jgi:hypothetical protein